jgi:uncharacterized RDD family membrane protein YckC
MTEPTEPPRVHWEAPQPVIGPAPGLAFAPHGQRLIAYLIDGLLIWLLLSIFWTPLALITAPGAEPASAVVGVVVAFAIVGVLVPFLYFPFFWASWGRTPGMRPFRLYVVRDADGTAFGWGTAFLRLLGLYVAASVFYLGFLWVFVDRRRRGWHDLIAGTVVIKRT